MWKPTKNPKIEEITRTFKGRSLRLSELMVKPESDGRRLCLWCAEVELKGSKLKKYCSPECSEAIFTWANPQKENGLHALLVRQDWKCNVCQYDYKPIRDEVHRRWYGGTMRIPNFGADQSLRYMKFLKDSCLPFRKPEVDHIVPIYKGGVSLGLANLQICCFNCHKAKTKIDLSGKRKKKE